MLTPHGMARTNRWKNWLLLRIINAFKPTRTTPPISERFLIVTSTALGDTLWATPALENLRKHLPNARISVLTSPIGEQILKNNPNIDELMLLKEPLLPRFFSLLSLLKKKRFDTAFIFHASQRLALPLCALAGIPRIIGTQGQQKGLDALLTEQVPAQFEHEILRRLHLIERLGVPKRTETLSYYVTKEEKNKAISDLAQAKRPFIAFHPGSKEPFRRWPPHYFSALGLELQKRFGGTVFLTGTPSEEPLLLRIKDTLNDAQIIPHRRSLRSFAALLDQMDLLVSNDTGPFHLACALNRPVVGLYVSTNPRLCGPHQAPHALTISREPTCIPCLKKRCRDPFCFLQISPKQVISACASLLRYPSF